MKAICAGKLIGVFVNPIEFALALSMFGLLCLEGPLSADTLPPTLSLSTNTATSSNMVASFTHEEIASTNHSEFTNEIESADSTNSAGEITIKLTRPVHHVTQSTDSTCWLACAVMVWGYYGVNTDEQTLYKKVQEITVLHHSGLKANKRECLIALAQMGGLQEGVLHQFGYMAEDVTNSLSAAAGGLSQLTNGLNKPTTVSLTPTNQSKSWFFSGGKFSINPLKYGEAKFIEYMETASPDKIIEAIKNQEPAVIVCREGSIEHAMVVTGVKLGTADSRKKPEIISLDLMDPAEKSDLPTKAQGEYLKTSLKAVFTKAIAQKILQKESETITKS